METTPTTKAAGELQAKMEYHEARTHYQRSGITEAEYVESRLITWGLSQLRIGVALAEQKPASQTADEYARPFAVGSEKFLAGQ